MHIKRKAIPKFWPVQRTGTKYVAVPSHEQSNAVPLIIIIRDLLELVKSKKELKKILNEKKILVNGRIIEEVNYPIALFDSIAIPSIKKFYRAGLKGRRMNLAEIKENEINSRIYKIINKTQLPGKKIQLNFSSGKNIISSEKISIGDFAVIDNIKNKILKTISLDKNIKVIIVKGKHMGESGKVREIIKEGRNVVAKIKTEKEDISTNIENLFAEE